MNAAQGVPNEATLIELTRGLGQQLIAANLMCATAESCTGGLVGHLITEVPGSSAYFAGGAIVYSYPAKERVVGVDHTTLVNEGAVSYAVAKQMAEGALRLYAADIAVAITGIAGPDGGTADKPVGTVHVHVCAADGYSQGERFVWQADRHGNKLLSAEAALNMMLDYLAQRAQHDVMARE